MLIFFGVDSWVILPFSWRKFNLLLDTYLYSRRMKMDQFGFFFLLAKVLLLNQ